MKNWRSQFHDLDLQEPGLWPSGPRVGLLAGLFSFFLVLAFFLDWQDGIAGLRAGVEKESALKATYRLKATQAANLPAYRARLAEIERSFGALLRQLPDRSEVASLVVEVNQAGVAQGLQFDLFRPAPVEIKREFYAELPIEITVTGAFHQVGRFASGISQLARIVTLNELRMVASKNGGLTVDAVAKTFRYLDDYEVAEQRRLAASAAKAKRSAK